jgi:acetyl esterase/lipase
MVSLLWACGGGTTSSETAAPTVTDVAAPSPAPPETTREIGYSGNQKLTVYAPAAGGPWPVVVLVHGFDVDSFLLEPLGKELATQGAVVYNISVTYEVFDSDDLKYDLVLPAAIEQEACAVRFARSTAADYGGDPTRVTLVGWSAGAATGAVVAIDGDDYQGDCAVTEGSGLPDAFVAYEGPYNWSHEPLGPLREDRFVAEPGMWEAIDPYAHIGDNPDLVVRLIHGGRPPSTDEWEVEIEHSSDYLAALLEAGYDADLVVVDGATHMDVARSYSSGFDATVEQVMDLARSG